MAITITKEQEDLILGMQAKLKFATNQLTDLQGKKSGALNTADVNYKTAMQVVCDQYDSQIASLQTDITNLESQLEGVK